MVSYAVACFTFAGVFTGFVPANGMPILAAWLLGAFIIQLTTAKGELEEGNLISGNVFLYFSGFFCLASSLSTFFKWFFPTVLGTAALDARVEGLAWLACTLALLLWAPVYYKNANGTFSLGIISVEISLILLTLKDLGLISGLPVNYAIAVTLALSGALILYCSAAVQLNTAYGRTVLPVAKPLIKPKS